MKRLLTVLPIMLLAMVLGGWTNQQYAVKSGLLDDWDLVGNYNTWQFESLYDATKTQTLPTTGLSSIEYMVIMSGLVDSPTVQGTFEYFISTNTLEAKNNALQGSFIKFECVTEGGFQPNSMNWVAYKFSGIAQATFLTSDMLHTHNIELYQKVDAENPTFIFQNGGSTSIINDVNDPITLAEILATVKAYDDGDQAYITPVVDSNTCGNFDVLGTCSIVLSATDYSGNKGSISITIYTISFYPTISTTASEIEVSYTQKLEQATLLNYFAAKDYAGETITNFSVESDNYSANYNKPSATPYEFKVKITSHSYTASATLRIKVTDIITPYFLVEDTINISLKLKLGVTEIIKIIQGTSSANFRSFTVVENTYEGNEEIEGIYSFKADAVTVDGVSKSYSYKIKVYSPEDTKNNAFMDFIDDYKWYLIGGAGALVLIASLAVVLIKRDKK